MTPVIEKNVYIIEGRLRHIRAKSLNCLRSTLLCHHIAQLVLCSHERRSSVPTMPRTSVSSSFLITTFLSLLLLVVNLSIPDASAQPLTDPSPSSLSTTIIPPTDNNATSLPSLLHPREILAHEKSGLIIEVWTEADCQGAAQVNHNVVYTDQNALQNPSQSYRIYRDLDDTEQLDFSTEKTQDQTDSKNVFQKERSKVPALNPSLAEAASSEVVGVEGFEGSRSRLERRRKKKKEPVDEVAHPPNQCFNYYQSAEPGTKANCWTLPQKFNCYRFWHH